MIDWLMIKVRFPHVPVNAGRVISLTETGEIEWEVQKRFAVEGSHSKTVSVKSAGSLDGERAEFLMVSGNPSKFLQGHNIFGSDDLCGLTEGMLQIVMQRLGYEFDDFTRQSVRDGNFEVHLIDINYSFALGSQRDVMSFIHAAEFTGRSRHGRSAPRPGTVYFGQHSRRWAMKFYSKWNEVEKGPKDRRIPDSLGEHKDKLLTWAENILRIELRLLSKELKKLEMIKAADVQLNIQKLFNEYLGKIEMNGQARISDEKRHELPSKLQSSYLLWSEGHHLAEVLPKATFYRHRKQLLEYGIDISMTIDREKKFSNVVPFIRVLEAKPATIPEWAYTDNLIYQPQKRSA